MGELIRRLENKTNEDEVERRKKVKVIECFLRHGHTPKGISKLLHLSDTEVKSLTTDVDEEILKDVLGI